MNRPRRALLICSHPAQYAAPIFRLLARDSRLEIQVAYCSLQGAQAQVDPGFGVEVKWDVPLLDGYPWVAVANRSPFAGADSFLGLINPGIRRLIRTGHFDAVVLYTGYMCMTFWIALAAAKWSGIPVLFGTDAHELAPTDRKRWKLAVKRWLWPRLFRLADVVVAPSSGTAALMRSLGIPEDRVALTPYCVDNGWWLEQSAKVDRTVVRARWNVPGDAVVVLFCAKLQPWKRPQDLLRAFARIARPNAYLVFAGDGPLRLALESEAQSLSVAGRVRFLGFVNQSGLPDVYTTSDVFVLPSEHEPFGVVVNEAMLCGCAVAVSDRVGARFDLVREGETGFVFSAGDVEALAALLRGLLSSPERLKQVGQAARKRMYSWSPENNVDRTVEAVETAVRHRQERKKQSDARGYYREGDAQR